MCTTRDTVEKILSGLVVVTAALVHAVPVIVVASLFIIIH